jgi:hypothetical protein
MARRRLSPFAILLATFALAEIVFSVAALGHRHPHPTDPVAVVSGGCRGSPGHSHSHRESCSHSAHGANGASPVAHQESPADSLPDGSSDSDCSICRFLAQLVIPAQWQMDLRSEEFSTEVVTVTSFDVVQPDHRFQQPRSPPWES